MKTTTYFHNPTWPRYLFLSLLKKKTDSSSVNAAVRENTVLIQNRTHIDENMPKYRFYFVPGTNHYVTHLLYYVLYLFESQSLIKETNK